jgi:hypothetical protein
MSETPFPNPQTTQFNPEAWDNTSTVSEDEIAFLDNHFVRFPTTQPNVTFPVSPTVPTLAIATNDTRAASAEFVQNAKNTQTWGALQTFNAGMVTNAINPLTDGGTLAIGNGAVNNVVNVMTNSNTGTLTLGSSGSTTRINAPLTPNYSYPVAAGKIGQVVSGTFTTTTTIVVNTPMTQWTISSLPAGTWLMTGSVNRGPNANGYVIIAITTSNNSFSGVLTQDFTNTTSAVGNVQTIAYVVQVPNSSTPYYIVGQTDTGTTWSQTFGAQNLNFRAIRIA